MRCPVLTSAYNATRSTERSRDRSQTALPRLAFNRRKLQATRRNQTGKSAFSAQFVPGMMPLLVYSPCVVLPRRPEAMGRSRTRRKSVLCFEGGYRQTMSEVTQTMSEVTQTMSE
eukprot:1892841-Rhodomonas_salina.1